MDHVRIDEGVKRKRTIVAMRRDPETGLVQAIPAELDPQEVLDMYRTDLTTSQIAMRFGVTRKSMVAWLRQVAPKDWKDIQVTRAYLKKDMGDEHIMKARNSLSLARAREVLKSGQWDLERLDDDYKPQQPQVIVNNNNLSLEMGTIESISEILKAVASQGAATHLLQSTIEHNGDDDTQVTDNT